MRRKQMKKQKQVIIICSLCLLLCLCVGYAAFNTQLSIRAKGNVKEKPNCEFGGIKVNTVTDGDGLYKDEYEDGRCVYKGTNPNNYITFNNETWRIISVDSDGLIKIMRNESIGDMAWNDTDSNIWDTSSLNTYLNITYFNSLSNVKNVVNHNWNIGSVNGDDDLRTQIESEKATVWNGNVGLITVSEYINANSNIERCGTVILNNNNRSSCILSNWIYDITFSDVGTLGSFGSLWMISAGKNYNNLTFNITNEENYEGYVSGDTSSNARGVAPVVYLNPDIILNGNGTEDDPFIIEE